MATREKEEPIHYDCGQPWDLHTRQVVVGPKGGRTSHTVCPDAPDRPLDHDPYRERQRPAYGPAEPDLEDLKWENPDE